MSARDESAAEKLLEALDPDQRAVAQYAAGPMAVLAGAGTGKTRAITYRIAYPYFPLCGTAPIAILLAQRDWWVDAPADRAQGLVDLIGGGALRDPCG